ncbi:protein kinase [Gemmatirosa kalamazoonensis]|uniref:Protein kinase n=1 Tax=Gemmatirosa kalamazoonensis TaxID=861299 RepID=W0RCW0_9BACT|nr:serine/threonine-protein kinase [Gemmatirosa kalamazoonensis]AHG88160.1 protein kinase [Gemmatirosa kalamazoonensis]
MSAATGDESVRRIGPYRVLRELGRGGMGVVYLAERDDGQYRQRVAVKLLRASPDADELQRRFLAERQILASLSHANVAQLLDGGVSDGQLPYLVIEHVDGLPITEYCDRHRLSIDSRLRLFQDVCAAVHHAHQKLVLHRDLKPGNVFVTPAGQVKLLDFGIAKLLDPTMEAQPVTRTAFRFMTPAYASPEQVRGDSPTTASDVYALGLLLYELLAGRPAQRIDTDAPQAVYAAVCEREPERPSAAATRDPAAATARDLTTEKLGRVLRGDLDAIVAMALRKEPGRRYGSAELLADDVGRYLDGLPVLAHRGSGFYRFEKLMRRHRAVAAVAVTGACLLVVGSAVALRQAAVAARERDRAAAALQQTRRALGESEAVTAFLASLFEASDPMEARSDTLTTADLLRRGLARADQLGDEPLAQARMFEALGRVYASLEDLPRADGLLRRALALRRAQLGAEHVQTAALEARLAGVLREKGEYAAADTLAREALRVRRLTLGDAHPDVAASLRQLGSLAVAFGDFAAGEDYKRRAIVVDRGRGADSALAHDLMELGSLLLWRGDFGGAERARREALAATRRAFPGPHTERIGAAFALADVLDERTATFAEAESLAREGLAESRAAFGDAHVATAGAMQALGNILARHGKVAESESLVRQALAMERRTLGPSNLGVASGMLDVGLTLTHDGYSTEAERLTRDAVAMFGATYGTNHAMYAGALGYLADVVAKRGALDSAEALLRRNIAIRERVPASQQAAIAVTDIKLAGVLTRQRRFAEADSLYRWAVAELRRTAAAETNINVRLAYAGMASLYAAWGKPDSAALFRRRAQPPGFTAPWQR